MVKVVDKWNPFEMGWIAPDTLCKVMNFHPLSKILNISEEPKSPTLSADATAEQKAAYDQDMTTYATELANWKVKTAQEKQNQKEAFESSPEVVFYRDITRRNLEAVLESVHAVVLDLDTYSESNMRTAF